MLSRPPVLHNHGKLTRTICISGAPKQSLIPRLTVSDEKLGDGLGTRLPKCPAVINMEIKFH